MPVLKWQREKERIGRVFIRSKEDGEKLRVESAYFSNFDYRWYDIDGNLHPLYEKYQGKPYKVGFHIKNSDGKGNLEPFDDELKLPFKLGERGYVTQEIVSDGAVVLKNVIGQFSDQWGLKELAETDWLERMRYHVVSAFFFPGRKVEENVSANAFLPLWFFVDMLEDLGWTFAELTRVTRIIMSILRQEEIPPVPEDDPIAQAAVQVSKIFTEKTTRRRSAEASAPLVDAMGECFEALSIKMSTEWRDTYSTHSERTQSTYKHLRDITVAAVIALEVYLFEVGHIVSKNVRSCFWYKMLIRALTANISCVNDMLSYQKEFLADGLTSNNVWILMKNGDSLKTAMKKMADMSNSSVDDVNYFGDLLLDQFRGTEEYGQVETVIHAVRGIMDSHLQVYPNMDRYHKDLVYDCIVDEAMASPV